LTNRTSPSKHAIESLYEAIHRNAMKRLHRWRLLEMALASPPLLRVD
jgi:hypothetical protein